MAFILSICSSSCAALSKSYVTATMTFEEGGGGRRGGVSLRRTEREEEEGEEKERGGDIGKERVVPSE